MAVLKKEQKNIAATTTSTYITYHYSKFDRLTTRGQWPACNMAVLC